MATNKPTDADFSKLLEFRNALRRFLEWSRTQAADHGLTPSQHQLLLVIRGTEDRAGTPVKNIAEQLLIRHHSAVELVDRAEEAGIVKRITDKKDARVVRVCLTPRGRRIIEKITRSNLDELERLGFMLKGLDRKFEPKR